MHGWQANEKGTCAPPVKGRAMPKNEIPPTMRGDYYFYNFGHFEMRQGASAAFRALTGPRLTI